MLSCHVCSAMSCADQCCFRIFEVCEHCAAQHEPHLRPLARLAAQLIQPSDFVHGQQHERRHRYGRAPPARLFVRRCIGVADFILAICVSFLLLHEGSAGHAGHADASRRPILTAQG